MRFGVVGLGVVVVLTVDDTSNDTDGFRVDCIGVISDAVEPSNDKAKCLPFKCDSATEVIDLRDLLSTAVLVFDSTIFNLGLTIVLGTESSKWFAAVKINLGVSHVQHKYLNINNWDSLMHAKLHEAVTAESTKNTISVE